MAEPGQDLQTAGGGEGLKSGSDGFGGIAVELGGRAIPTLHAMTHASTIAIDLHEDLFIWS